MTGLSDLIQPPLPPGPSQKVGYRQGTVLEFDQLTLNNVVDVGGTRMVNLPLLGVSDASTLVTGAVVGLLAIESTLGTTTYGITGRWVIPGTAAAAEAISLLSVKTKADSIATQETCSTFGFSDLTTVGPTVTIDVGPSGRLLVILTSQIQWIDADAADGNGGLVSVAMSGANTMTANAGAAVINPTAFFASTSTANAAVQGTYTAAAVFSGLNPGTTTLTMKYSIYIAGETTDFGKRTVVAIAL